MRRKSDKLDTQIAALYTRHAQGIQINVMDIGKLYADVRAAVATGTDTETAVKAAIQVYGIKA